ncbi:GNAT family N-acetyltransferase [Cryobacterium sp. TMT2-10]|uniref:GNAT family N-acetyltransferase n=1 Tax=Cryobacterium sp. TMT2-10 TaxID=1259244 RepID=UPI00141BC3F5|nr:GNAT family N-acetyltransferase [Cryobacterium sp. TMT2-10]
MEPVDLSSPLLRLDQPTPADAETIFAYCQDPLFEKYLTVPWPYTRAHADSFIAEYVPGGWASDLEYTWAVRAADAPELLGVIGFRVPDASLGYWLGAPHRGRGLIPEAQRLVIDWVFANGIVSTVNWQCLVGNMPSSRTAWRAGFTFTGEAPAVQVHRDGTYPPAGGPGSRSRERPPPCRCTATARTRRPGTGACAPPTTGRRSPAGRPASPASGCPLPPRLPRLPRLRSPRRYGLTGLANASSWASLQGMRGANSGQPSFSGSSAPESHGPLAAFRRIS